MNVDPNDGPMIWLCDIMFLDTGEVIHDVVPSEARIKYRGRDFRETYTYRFKGRYTPYFAGLVDAFDNDLKD